MTKTTCIYCGRSNDVDRELCSSCGAPIQESFDRDRQEMHDVHKEIKSSWDEIDWNGQTIL